jgi:hypothetical protein
MFNKKKQPPIKSLIAHGSQITGNFSFFRWPAAGWRVTG